MGINVFEGARRIAKLVLLLWVAGCVIFTINDVLDLRKQNLEAQAKQGSIAKETPYQGDKNALYAEFEQWKATRKQNNTPISPANADETPWRQQGGLPIFTPEQVAAYRANKMPKQEPSWLDRSGQKTWDHIWTGSLWLFGGIAFIWALTWAIGWIVRGFFGIPAGHDFKP
jgi:hypothetical protein